MSLRTGFVVAGALMALAAAAGPSEAATCDRACLRTVLDQYLNAVEKHDASLAPLDAGFRQTENAIATSRDQGIWKSVTSWGKTVRKYYDPVQESAGIYATINEGDAGAPSGSIATLRIKVVDRKITEAEWVVARPNTGTPQANGPGSTDAVAAEAANAQPPASRLPGRKASRSELIGLANGYFDSLQSGNAKLFASSEPFIRLENGVKTGTADVGGRRGGGAGAAAAFAGLQGTGAPAAGAGPAGAPAAAAPRAGGGGGRAAGPGPLDGVCGGQCMVGARRFPVVDEEAGVVLGMVLFIRQPGVTTRRNLLTEWFTVGDGKIHGIYASMHFLSPTIPAPNWEPYVGNWPLPPYLPGSNERVPALAASQGPAQ